jgi:hypothetical protein
MAAHRLPLRQLGRNRQPFHEQDAPQRDLGLMQRRQRISIPALQHIAIAHRARASLGRLHPAWSSMQSSHALAPLPWREDCRRISVRLSAQRPSGLRRRTAAGASCRTAALFGKRWLPRCNPNRFGIEHKPIKIEDHRAWHLFSCSRIHSYFRLKKTDQAPHAQLVRLLRSSRCDFAESYTSAFTLPRRAFTSSIRVSPVSLSMMEL